MHKTHMHTLKRNSITNRSRTMEARAAEAKASRRDSAVLYYMNTEFGPLDKVTNLTSPHHAKEC